MFQSLFRNTRTLTHQVQQLATTLEYHGISEGRDFGWIGAGSNIYGGTGVVCRGVKDSSLLRKIGEIAVHSPFCTLFYVQSMDHTAVYAGPISHSDTEWVQEGLMKEEAEEDFTERFFDEPNIFSLQAYQAEQLLNERIREIYSPLEPNLPEVFVESDTEGLSVFISEIRDRELAIVLQQFLIASIAPLTFFVRIADESGHWRVLGLEKVPG